MSFLRVVLFSPVKPLVCCHPLVLPVPDAGLVVPVSAQRAHGAAFVLSEPRGGGSRRGAACPPPAIACPPPGAAPPVPAAPFPARGGGAGGCRCWALTAGSHGGCQHPGAASALPPRCRAPAQASRRFPQCEGRRGAAPRRSAHRPCRAPPARSRPNSPRRRLAEVQRGGRARRGARVMRPGGDGAR